MTKSLHDLLFRESCQAVLKEALVQALVDRGERGKIDDRSPSDALPDRRDHQQSAERRRIGEEVDRLHAQDVERVRRQEERILEQPFEVQKIVPRAAQYSLAVVEVLEGDYRSVDRDIVEDEQQNDRRDQQHVEGRHALGEPPLLARQRVVRFRSGSGLLRRSRQGQPPPAPASGYPQLSRRGYGGVKVPDPRGSARPAVPDCAGSGCSMLVMMR